MQAAITHGGDLRPSLEAAFHALPGRVMLHTHLVEVLAGLCLVGGENILRDVLKETGEGIAWVDYQPPGQALAKKVREARLKDKNANIILMANHGLIVVAEEVETALDLTRKIQSACLEAFPCNQAPTPLNDFAALKSLKKNWAEKVGGVARISSNPWVTSLCLGNEWAWQPVCPDDVIYVGKDFPLITRADLGQAKKLDKILPADAKRLALAVKDTGVLLAAKDERALDFMEEMLYANARARAMARTRGDIHALDLSQRLDLLGMEGDKYRQGLKWKSSFPCRALANASPMPDIPPQNP